ncbi:hypothetical protein pb186bvf_012614 [Paramecium bursaria]
MKITSKETYTDYESTQPSQTQIQQLPVPFVKNTRALSPMEMPKKPKIKLQQSKSYNYEEEESFTEHNIWGDKEQELPFVISNNMRLQHTNQYHVIIQQFKLKDQYQDIHRAEQNILPSEKFNGQILEIGVLEQIDNFLFIQKGFIFDLFFVLANLKIFLFKYIKIQKCHNSIGQGSNDNQITTFSFSYSDEILSYFHYQNNFTKNKVKYLTQIQKLYKIYPLNMQLKIILITYLNSGCNQSENTQKKLGKRMRNKKVIILQQLSIISYKYEYYQRNELETLQVCRNA